MLYNLSKVEFFLKIVFENLNKSQFTIIDKICKAYTKNKII